MSNSELFRTQPKWSDRLASDRGDFPSSLMAFLVVIALFMLSVHGVFVYHGNNVLASAAQEALLHAQFEGAPGSDAESRGKLRGDAVIELFPALDATVDVQQVGDNWFRVVATGTVTTPLFAQKTELTAVAEGPIERFIQENERRDGVAIP